MNAWAAAWYGVISESIADPAEDRQDQDHEGGQADVQKPQPPRGRPDRRRQRLVFGAWHLRLDERAAAADAEARQDRQAEDHDAHAAEPLGEAAPEAHRLIERGNVREHARPGGRHPRHRLEVRVHRGPQLGLAEHVGHRDRERRQRPGERDDQESLPGADRLSADREPLQAEAERRRDRARRNERPDRIAVPEADGNGEEERQAEVLDHAPDEVECAADIDADGRPLGAAQPNDVTRHSARSTW